MENKSLFEMKRDLQMLGENAKAANSVYEKSLTDINSDQEIIDSYNQKATEAQKRYDQYKTLVEKKERSEVASLEQASKKAVSQATSEANQVVESVAGMLRNVVKSNQSFDVDAFNQATGVSVNGGEQVVGDNFLPITVSNDVITEPNVPNPLRGKIATSAIPNLRIPAVDVDFGDAWAVIGEGEKAKDLSVTGTQITFSRFESRVRVGFTDTLLAGSSLNLLQFAQDKLANGASVLELARAFAADGKAQTGEEHMSFYDASNKIASVGGDTLFQGITNALAELSDADADAASIFMTRKDYNSIIATLANGSATLYAAQPEQVFGVPVYFTSYAAKPVVGNFALYQQNYDPAGSIVEQYRDPAVGTTYAQFTLWYDARVKRPSAFRIVDLAAPAAPKA